MLRIGVSESNYTSGDDFVVEFLGYRFSFNGLDFEQRVNAAAVRLGLIEPGELGDEETADLVELTAHGRIDEPRSGLGEYLVRHWERLALVNDESLVYWLRKLIFRGAWLDQRVKENLLEVDWDDTTAEFGYRDPDGGPRTARARPGALVARAPVPALARRIEEHVRSGRCADVGAAERVTMRPRGVRWMRPSWRR